MTAVSTSKRRRLLTLLNDDDARAIVEEVLFSMQLAQCGEAKRPDDSVINAGARTLQNCLLVYQAGEWANAARLKGGEG